MPYKDPQKRREANARYAAKNKDKIAARVSKWTKETKPWLKPESIEYMANYRVEHAEEISIQTKERCALWYEKNRDEELVKRQAWRDENRDLVRAQHKASHCRNREKRLAEMRAYYLEHREEMLVEMKIYRLEHLDEKRVYLAAYYLANRERLLENMAQYAVDHPEVYAAARVRYRARKAGAPINDFTAAQWRLMQEICDHFCAYCRERAPGKLHREHLTPLSKGGPNTWSNILPACAKCNSEKGTGPVLCPVQPFML